MDNSNKESDSKWVKVLSIIVAVSLAGNLILFMKRSENFPVKKELVERIDKLSDQLSTYKSEINKYKGISGRIDAVIMDANRKLDAKEQQIAALKREKKMKESENQALLMQLDSLQDQYLGVIDSLLVEREQQKVLNQKLEGLQIVIDNLNTRIGMAEMLVGDNLTVTPLKENRRGQSKPSAMVKNVHEIGVCIDILENRIGKTGKQLIYIVITSPNAEVLVDRGAGRPEFFHAEYKTQAHCSRIEEINYQREKIHLCSSIIPESITGAGLYLVEVFCDSQKLGMTTFTLR